MYSSYSSLEGLYGPRLWNNLGLGQLVGAVVDPIQNYYIVAMCIDDM